MKYSSSFKLKPSSQLICLVVFNVPIFEISIVELEVVILMDDKHVIPMNPELHK